MANPLIADAPCLRCGTVATWRRNKAGKPYAWCVKAGGCGAVMTLGADDPFPKPRLPVPAGDTPAATVPQAPPATTPTPEPEPDDGTEPAPVPTRKPRAWGLLD